MVVTPSGIVTEEREVQSSKALLPMLPSPSLSVTSERLEHPVKAAQLMAVTLPGMVTEVRLLQLENAIRPMDVTAAP